MPASSGHTESIPLTARRVSHGYVDLFIAPIGPGGEPAERYHLVRVVAGEPLVDLGLSPDRGFLLIESPSPDLEVEDLHHALTRSDTGLWVRSLMATANRTPPAVPRPLSLGPFTADAPEIATANELLWVCPQAGSVRFNDILELRRGVYCPLSPGAFLAIAAGAEITCATTESVFEQGLAAGALAEFHRTILGWLALRLLEETERAATRRQQREQTEQSLFARSLTALAEPSGVPAALGAGGADPLRLACFTVWAALGVNLDHTRASRLHPTPPGSPIDRQRIAAEELARGAAIRSRRVQLSGRWWAADCGPLLAWVQDTEAPVSLVWRRRGYLAVDPVTGLSRSVDQSVAESLAAAALMFYRPLPERPMGFQQLFRYAVERRGPDLWYCAWTGAAAGLLTLLPPVAAGILVDHVIPSGDRGQLWVIFALLIAAAVASSAFTLARQLAVLRLEMKVAAEIVPAIWDRLLRLPASFFRQFTVGDLGQRAMVFDDVRRGIAHSLAISVFTGVSALMQVLLLTTVNTRLALFAGLLLLLAATAAGVSAWLQAASQEDIAEVQGRLAGRVLQLLNGIPKFRTSGAERRMFVLWAEQFGVFKSLGFRLRLQSNRLIVFQSVFPLLGSILLFALAGGSDARIHPGAFVVFLTAFLQALAGVVEVSAAWSRTVAQLPKLARTLPILQATAEVSAAQESPGELAGAIEVSQVTFRYGPGQPLVLRGLSFRIEPGQFVAFVGDSGAGKSTLIRLLLGFEVPEQGSVRFDNQDLAGLDVEAVRKQMGVVLQSGRLLTGDIFSNIVGASGVSLDDAWEAARLAGMADEIKAMPMGMYTLVGEGGSSLSGGQRQRLLMARAIVARPKILLLDEATSALDNITQSIVTRSLGTLRATRIVIAHRLTTIQHADRIFVLDQGRVVEAGSFDELMAANGKFAQLAQRQLL
jgi:NHLM bacteriocin system ABC transporter ATP-binding protein